MRDYKIQIMGRDIAIADMPTPLLRVIAAEPRENYRQEGDTSDDPTFEQLQERVRLELDIRALEGRT